MRRIRFCIAAGVMLFLFSAAAVTVSDRSAPRDGMSDMLEQAEILLGEEWKKQSVTEVADMVYSDGRGNTIVYYICTTAYYDGDSAGQNGLNTEAISAVISPGEAESCRECTVSGLPAVICKKDGRAYLCWTVIPELSCVLEYDPAAVREEDMFRMARSVPVTKAKAAEP